MSTAPKNTKVTISAKEVNKLPVGSQIERDGNLWQKLDTNWGLIGHGLAFVDKIYDFDSVVVRIGYGDDPDKPTNAAGKSTPVGDVLVLAGIVKDLIDHFDDDTWECSDILDFVNKEVRQAFYAFSGQREQHAKNRSADI